jgi:hypothetical protein
VYVCVRVRACVLARVCVRARVRVVQGEELAECVLAGRFLYPRSGATPDPRTNTPTHSPSGESVRAWACVHVSVRALGGGIGVERSGGKVCVQVCSNM